VHRRRGAWLTERSLPMLERIRQVFWGHSDLDVYQLSGYAEGSGRHRVVGNTGEGQRKHVSVLPGVVAPCPGARTRTRVTLASI
jgi:hypothetical protein